jgi:hypothetical protein
MNPYDQRGMEYRVNNSICEAVGCFEKAATTIIVRVGRLGSISLDLCTDCMKKFDNGNTPEKEDSKQRIVTNEEGKDKEAIEE